MDIGTSLSPLSDEDAAILALESGTIRGHTLKILVFDSKVTGSHRAAAEN